LHLPAIEDPDVRFAGDSKIDAARKLDFAASNPLVKGGRKAHCLTKRAVALAADLLKNSGMRAEDMSIQRISIPLPLSGKLPQMGQS
jgi:hypothetical protein